MPPKKKASRTPSAKRQQTVPVRIAESFRPATPLPPEPEPTRPAKPAPAKPSLELETRRRVATIGIIVVLLAVTVLWAVTVGAQLLRPGESNSLFSRIGAGLRSVFGGSQGQDARSETEQTFDEYDAKLFPDVP